MCSDSPPPTKLILIRHSVAERLPDVPWHEWPLSDEGRRLCVPLAARVRGYQPAVIITSTERKARETGQLVACRMGLTATASDGLQENDRTGLPRLPREGLIRLVSTFFQERDALIMGTETASHALDRFTTAVAAVVGRHPEANIAVVTHGTVLSLFVSAKTGCDAMEFWSGLGIPALVVMSLPDYRLIEVVPHIAL